MAEISGSGVVAPDASRQFREQLNRMEPELHAGLPPVEELDISDLPQWRAK